jgi:phage tail-like protein
MASGALSPLHVFKFHVDFFSSSLSNDSGQEQLSVCSGSFAECTGLEATMEPKVIKEGGRNYGNAQRAGGTAFATVVLKRGISSNQNLYQLFNTIAIGTFAQRMQVTINLFDIDGSAVLAWQLVDAMPIKYKFADLNSRNGEVGIEELHLAHEGLWSTDATVQQL